MASDALGMERERRGTAPGKAVDRDVVVEHAGAGPAAVLLMVLLLGVILPIAGVVAYAGWNYVARATPKDVTTTYRYDAIRDTWLQTTEEQEVFPDEKGAIRRGINTIIIRVNQDDPIKEIRFDETLVIGDRTNPLVEIQGSGDLLGSGKLNIGVLAFLEVDAGELEIDADIMRINLEKTVAEDNELKLNLNVVNVVRILRGGSSSLFFGKNRSDRFIDAETFRESGDSVDGKLIVRGGKDSEKGLRVDRIRILGPSSGTAFVELIVFKRMGVMGKIDVDNVEIQDLVLRDVTLDDSF